ncbi:MAG TPA: hypothetical protein DCL41_07640 [Bdellovibrionales bacterium]|nr:hypothetical protein [Pseudobdellovibrionaceae bacterium]HAG91728.1 hypothetical protein [Bdellovibrionales bacterium]|tara:strand:- start:955 stop:2265 length:1311 start_codon:yes stop_codon:yes gene_type:complete
MKTILMTLAALMLSSAAQAECPVGTAPYAKSLGGKPTCSLSGTYKDDLYLPNSNSYVLIGGVFMGYDNGKVGQELSLDPMTLTIQAGTQIFALNPKKDLSLPESQRIDRKDFLVISRGSKIEAAGTVDAPIVFSSAQGMHLAADQREAFPRARGDWGGLILNGKAPTNVCPDLTLCSAEGEAGTGYYGGNEPADNSGTLRYVRVEFGGDKINDEKEFNGITFNGVGSATNVNFVQVHKNNDDAIEFFGGNVNAKNLVLTGSGDDSIDWTFGYRGMIQYAIAQNDADDGDNGVEADNAKNVDLEPRSNPTLSNITLIGGPTTKRGLLLRVGSGGMIANSLVMGYKTCVDTETAHLPMVEITNNAFSCADLGSALSFPNNQEVDQKALLLNGYLPQEGSMLLATPSIELEDLFFDVPSFIGAVGDVDWTAGWTTAAQQ